MLLLIIQANYTMPVVLTIAGILSLATAIAAVLVTRTVYKSTLPSRLAETTKQNYDAEKARADRLNGEIEAIKAERKAWLVEKDSLVTDYTQLTQLYARKSVILENLIPIFSNMADLAEHGRLGEYLKSLDSPLVERDGIHKTKG